MKIFKYTLDIAQRQVVQLPTGAIPLTVQMQHYKPQLWALVDENSPSEDREFLMIGTGHPVDYSPEMVYLSTIQISNGEFVFHIFERI